MTNSSGVATEPQLKSGRRPVATVGTVSDDEYASLCSILTLGPIRVRDEHAQLEARGDDRSEIVTWMLDRILAGRTGGLSLLATSPALTDGMAEYVLDRVVPSIVANPWTAEQCKKDLTRDLIAREMFREESYAGEVYREWLCHLKSDVPNRLDDAALLLVADLAPHISWSTSSDLCLALSKGESVTVGLHYCKRIANHPAADRTVWLRLIDMPITPLTTLSEIDAVLLDGELAAKLLLQGWPNRDRLQGAIERALRLNSTDRGRELLERLLMVHPKEALLAASNTGHYVSPEAASRFLSFKDANVREAAILAVSTPGAPP